MTTRFPPLLEDDLTTTAPPVPAAAPILTVVDQRATSSFVAKSLPVVAGSQTFRDLMRLAVPVCAGDRLVIYADAKFTNDAGTKAGQERYTVGVGGHLWWYLTSVPSGAARDATYERIDPSLGENVTPDTHHMSLSIQRTLTIPDTWRPGDHIGIALRAAAMSTRWKTNGGKDLLTVDQDGILTVMVLRRVTLLDVDRVAALEDRVATIERALDPSQWPHPLKQLPPLAPRSGAQS